MCSTFISQRRKEPSLTLFGDAVKTFSTTVAGQLNNSCDLVTSFDSLRNSRGFTPKRSRGNDIANPVRDLSVMICRRGCRQVGDNPVKGNCISCTKIPPAFHPKWKKSIPDSLRGQSSMEIDDLVRSCAEHTPVIVLLSAVRRGVVLSVLPTSFGRSLRKDLEVSTEQSTLFERPFLERNRKREIPVPPKATALSMAALAFERATEDLDEEDLLGHQTSTLVLPQDSLVELNAWESKNKNLGEAANESQHLLNNEVLNPEDIDVPKANEEEMRTVKLLIDETNETGQIRSLSEQLSPLPLSIIAEEREIDALVNEQYQYAEFVVPVLSSDSESDEVEWEALQAGTAAQELHTDVVTLAKNTKMMPSLQKVEDCPTRYSRTLRLKAAARRAKSELRAAAAAAAKVAGGEEESERLSFLGLTADHDKQTVRQPLLARRMPLEAFIINPVIPLDITVRVKQILRLASMTYEARRWQRCLLACSAIATSAADTISCIIPALELRAACWMKLRVWHQVVADCTMVLQTRGASSTAVSRAYARRSHARLELSHTTPVFDQGGCDAVQLANFALVDAKLGRKCEDKINSASSTAYIHGVDLDFEDDPPLLRAGVLRGLGKLRAARIELECANRMRPHNWRLLWSLGDLLADEVGLTPNVSEISDGKRVASMMHDTRRITYDGAFESRLKEDTYPASLDTTANLISKAVAVAVSTNAMPCVPFELITRYGNIQLVRMRQKHNGVTKSRKSDDSSSSNSQLHDELITHAIQLQSSVCIVHDENTHRSPVALAHIAFLAAAATLQVRI